MLDVKATLDEAGITDHDAALRQAAGQDFYNTCKFALRTRRIQQQLRADFEAYLDVDWVRRGGPADCNSLDEGRP